MHNRRVLPLVILILNLLFILSAGIFHAPWIRYDPDIEYVIQPLLLLNGYPQESSYHPALISHLLFGFFLNVLSFVQIIPSPKFDELFLNPDVYLVVWDYILLARYFAVFLAMVMSQLFLYLLRHTFKLSWTVSLILTLILSSSTAYLLNGTALSSHSLSTIGLIIGMILFAKLYYATKVKTQIFLTFCIGFIAHLILLNDIVFALLLPMLGMPLIALHAKKPILTHSDYSYWLKGIIAAVIILFIFILVRLNSDILLTIEKQSLDSKSLIYYLICFLLVITATYRITGRPVILSFFIIGFVCAYMPFYFALSNQYLNKWINFAQFGASLCQDQFGRLCKYDLMAILNTLTDGLFNVLKSFFYIKTYQINPTFVLYPLVSIALFIQYVCKGFNYRNLLVLLMITYAIMLDVIFRMRYQGTSTYPISAPTYYYIFLDLPVLIAAGILINKFVSNKSSLTELFYKTSVKYSLISIVTIGLICFSLNKYNKNQFIFISRYSNPNLFCDGIRATSPTFWRKAEQVSNCKQSLQVIKKYYSRT